MAVQALYRFDSPTYGNNALFVELFQELHYIKYPDTAKALFGNDPQETHQNPPYPEGFQIDGDSFLLREPHSKGVYLMTNGKKYGIVSEAAFEHYQFNKGTLYPKCEEDDAIAAWALGMTPSGPNISE